MYTVVWQDNGQDRWDRFETQEAVRHLLHELSENPNVCIGDVWIFAPEADEYACTPDLF